MHKRSRGGVKAQPAAAPQWRTVERRRQGKIRVQERLDHTGLKLTRWTCSACGKWAYHSEADAQSEAARITLRGQWVHQCRYKLDPSRWHLSSKPPLSQRPQRTEPRELTRQDGAG